MSGWALAYALELVVTIPAGKVIWAKAKLAGALALPPLWVALSLYTTGRPGRLDRRVLAALLGLTVLTLMLLWAAAANSAVWRLARPDAWVIVACSYGLLFVGETVLLPSLFAARTLYRRQSALLLLAALAPWTANASSLAGLSPVARLDLTRSFFR